MKTYRERLAALAPNVRRSILDEIERNPAPPPSEQLLDQLGRMFRQFELEDRNHEKAA